MTNSMIETLKARRKVDKAGLEAFSIRIAAAPASQAREMRVKFAAGADELDALNARIEELEEGEARENRAAAHRVEMNVPGGNTGPGYSVGGPSSSRFTTNGPEIYNDPHEVGTDAPSFFRDVRNSKMGDWDAADRLNRNQQARGMETRAGDMTTVAGAGGTFAPPLWLVQDFIALARPGRVTADLLAHEQLPSGVSSISLPKVASGATTAIQATQNSALSDTAMTTTSVSSGISLIGGKQIISLQLMQQSGIPFDRVILGDLAADYAQRLDLQVLAGSGASGQLRGVINAAGAGSTVFTSATPKVTSATAADSFYNKVIAAATTIHTTRFRPANAIVMHPNRWAWVLEALDSTTRPLVVTDGAAFNPVGTTAGVVAQGSCGKFAGLPVYLDANVTVTTGAGSATNQDLVYVMRGRSGDDPGDLTLWESDLQVDSFEATYADNASVLFRCMAYSAMIPDRWAGSVNLVSGTGLVAPVL
jgi:HK97 family phage major capsid protein